jgi:hypothetical protein
MLDACRDNPANPRNPVQLIGQINNTIDTALGHVDALLNKVLPVCLRSGSYMSGEHWLVVYMVASRTLTMYGLVATMQLQPVVA